MKLLRLIACFFAMGTLILGLTACGGGGGGSTAAAGGGSGGGGGSGTCSSTETSMTYSTSNPAAVYANGDKVCFTASTTALSFSGKTLTSPVQNMAVSLPYSAYAFTDSSNSYVYEVVFNGSALYEINVSIVSTFHGQFAPTP